MCANDSSCFLTTILSQSEPGEHGCLRNEKLHTPSIRVRRTVAKNMTFLFFMYVHIHSKIRQ